MDVAFTGDTGFPLRFLLEDVYRVGQIVSVDLQNVGLATYIFNPYYQACEMAYVDAGGRSFKIPPGTHCDLITEDYIRPGEAITLFVWALDECVVDRWGCAVARPLPPGVYTIRGEFRSTGGDSAIAQKTFAITADDDKPVLLPLALGAFVALVAAGVGILSISARRPPSPRRSP